MRISAFSLIRQIAPVCLFGVLVSVTSHVWAEPDSRSDSPALLSIEGISANVGEDEPRVLTILPWRAPSLPRRPRAELESMAPELVEPMGALVLERHRVFRQNLGVADSAGQPGARR